MEPPYYPMNQFAHAMSPHQGLLSSQCELTVRQQPLIGRVAVGEEKNRKPVDPPPIVQLKVKTEVDPEQSYLQSPYFFVSCNLVQPSVGRGQQPSGTSLAGTLVSSLHRLKDSDNTESAFFIFGDLSVKLEGRFALQFNLYEMRDSECFHVHSILSEEFPVHGPKHFPGLSESTPLTRSFSEQGVRLRVRKEPRTLLRKRGPASDNYIPRSYNRQRLHLDTSEDQAEEVEDSPESSRHSQAEQQGSLQSPLEGLRGQQMGLTREYSHPSAYSSYSEEPTFKRPRTGSEQSEFGQQSQQTAFAQQSQQLTYGQQRPAPLSSYGSYPQQSPQQIYGVYQYAQSPSTITRGDYFGQRAHTQQGMTSPSYHQPAPANFPPQSQAQYHQVPAYGGQLPPSPSMQGVPNPYGSMGMPEASRPSGMGEAEMAPLRFARTASTPSYASMMGDPGDRRSYVVPVPYGNIQNLSAGSMRVGTTRSPSVPITTGPGPMDNTYQ